MIEVNWAEELYGKLRNIFEDWSKKTQFPQNTGPRYTAIVHIFLFCGNSLGSFSLSPDLMVPTSWRRRQRHCTQAKPGAGAAVACATRATRAVPCRRDMASGRNGRAVAKGMDRDERHENNSCSQEFSGILLLHHLGCGRIAAPDSVSNFIFQTLVAEKGEPGRIRCFFSLLHSSCCPDSARKTVNLRLHFNHLPHIAPSGPQSKVYQHWRLGTSHGLSKLSLKDAIT